MADPSEVDRLRTKMGQAINAARTQEGLSQTSLGELMDVAQTTVSRWERGAPEGVITLDDVIALEDVLHLNRGELLVAGGYVPPVEDAEQALKLDPRITDRLDKLGILALYRVLVQRTPQLPG